MKKPSILVGKDAYFFLNREERKQRGCKPLTEQQEDRIWNRVSKDGAKTMLDKDSLGGGDGTYYGRWWSWSLETLKAMLDEGGFGYEDGPEIEYMNI